MVLKFPDQRVRFMASVDGRQSSKGFIVLDLKGLDLDGVNQIALDMHVIEAAAAGGDKESEARRRAQALFGDIGDSLEEC